MSNFRDYEPMAKNDEFRWEDRKIIDKLLDMKKLTDKQRDAIRRLLATYDYARS